MAYFAASVDEPDTNRRFARELGVDYPILSDPSKETATAYGVMAQPSAAQPNPPQFARRWTFYIGPDGKILFIDKTPGTGQAGQNVVAKLKELGVKEK